MVPRFTADERKGEIKGDSVNPQKGQLAEWERNWTDDVIAGVNEIFETIASTSVMRQLQRLFSHSHDASRRKGHHSEGGSLHAEIGALAGKAKEISSFIQERGLNGETSLTAEEVAERADLLCQINASLFENAGEESVDLNAYNQLLEEIGQLASQIDFVILGINTGGANRGMVGASIDALLLSVCDSMVSKDLAYEVASLKNGFVMSSLRSFERDPFAEFIEVSSFDLNASRLQVRYQNELAVRSEMVSAPVQAA